MLLKKTHSIQLTLILKWLTEIGTEIEITALGGIVSHIPGPDGRRYRVVAPSAHSQHSLTCSCGGCTEDSEALISKTMGAMRILYRVAKSFQTKVVHYQKVALAACPLSGVRGAALPYQMMRCDIPLDPSLYPSFKR